MEGALAVASLGVANKDEGVLAVRELCPEAHPLVVRPGDRKVAQHRIPLSYKGFLQEGIVRQIGKDGEKIAAIVADCVVVSPEDDVNAWLTASGMWVEYQKLFDYKIEGTGTPNEFQFTAQLKSSVSNEIAVALNAASAKIPDCLKVKTVMVETKPGVLYAVFSSETADGTYTRDDAWVIGTGKEVPVKFKVEGEARFYKVKAAFKRGDD
mgnify:CR=1 FL=1